MRTKRVFQVKQRAFFIIFKGLSVAKNCLRPESAPLNSFVHKPVTHDELQKLISQLNNRKALSPKNIPVIIFKDHNDVLVMPLTLILNLSFEQGIFPELWKIAEALTVPKTEDSVTVRNYHPIFLLSVFSKIYEKALYHLIYSFSVSIQIQINLVFVQITQLNMCLLV